MEYQSGNIFLRPNSLDKGQSCEEHMHEFDHTTFFVRGKFQAQRWRQALDADNNPILVNKPGKDANGADVINKVEVWNLVSDRVFVAPQWCLIEKNVKHKFTSLEDGGMFFCIYSHRDPQSHEVVQDFNGWIKAFE